MKGREFSYLNSYYVTLSSKKASDVINKTLEFYVVQAVSYKRLFTILSIITMVLNASIPIINQIDVSSGKLIITVFSSITLIVTGLLTLVSVKDTWCRYRDCAEKLKTECNKYNGGIFPYNDAIISHNEEKLIQSFENLNLAERKLWKMQANQQQEHELKDENSTYARKHEE